MCELKKWQNARYAILDLPDAFNQMGIDLYGRWRRNYFNYFSEGILNCSSSPSPPPPPPSSPSSLLSSLFSGVLSPGRLNRATKKTVEGGPEVFLQQWIHHGGEQIWNKLKCENKYFNCYKIVFTIRGFMLECQSLSSIWKLHLRPNPTLTRVETTQIDSRATSWFFFLLYFSCIANDEGDSPSSLLSLTIW